MRRVGGALVLTGLVVLPMAATVRAPALHARLRARLGCSWSLLARGQMWRLFTSTFVQSGHGFVGGIVVLVLFVPLVAARIGSRIVVPAFLLGDWVSSLVVLAGARVVAAAGSATAQHVVSHLDSGASAACYACIGAGVWSLRGRLRRLAAAALALDLAVEGVVTHMLAEIQHPVAVLVGIGVAAWLAARAGTPRDIEVAGA